MAGAVHACNAEPSLKNNRQLIEVVHIECEQIREELSGSSSGTFYDSTKVMHHNRGNSSCACICQILEDLGSSNIYLPKLHFLSNINQQPILSLTGYDSF